MVEIINKQSAVSLVTRILEEFAMASLKNAGVEGTLTIAFVTDAEMQSLNTQFRAKATTTDVLSFPAETDHFDETPDFLGDIIISADQAKRQAEENGLTLELEVKQLIVHGILHLLGYDHETDQGQMNQLELQLRKQLGIE